MSTKLSIIIPAYQAKRTIRRAINSVIASKKNNFEVIVIDDGSTDDTSTIVSSFSDFDNRIKLYRQDNAGRAAARNLGYLKANGSHIMFLDSDDVLIPGALDRILESSFDEYPLIIYPYVMSISPNQLGCSSQLVHNPKSQVSFEIPSSVLKDWMLFGLIDERCNSFDLAPYEINSAWSKVYRKDCLETLVGALKAGPFPNGIRLSEDRLLNISALSIVGSAKIRFDPFPVYYWDLGNSRTVMAPTKRDASEIQSFCDYACFLYKVGLITYNEFIAICSREYISRFLNSAKYSSSTDDVNGYLWLRVYRDCKSYFSKEYLVPPYSGYRWAITRELIKRGNIVQAYRLERSIKSVKKLVNRLKGH